MSSGLTVNEPRAGVTQDTRQARASDRDVKHAGSLEHWAREPGPTFAGKKLLFQARDEHDRRRESLGPVHGHDTDALGKRLRGLDFIPEPRVDYSESCCPLVILLRSEGARHLLERRFVWQAFSLIPPITIWLLAKQHLDETVEVGGTIADSVLATPILELGSHVPGCG